MIKASRETIKMRTNEGEVKVAVLVDSPGPEEYLQHISSFVRMLERKKISEDMLKLAKAVASMKAPVRRLTTAPTGEKPADKTVRLEKLEVAVNALVEAQVHEDAKLETVYKLFRKTLKEDPVDRVWQCAIQRVYTRKYHTEPPTSCVEESVQSDSHDSSRVSEGHSIGPRESREGVCRKVE